MSRTEDIKSREIIKENGKKRHREKQKEKVVHRESETGKQKLIRDCIQTLMNSESNQELIKVSFGWENAG